MRHMRTIKAVIMIVIRINDNRDDQPCVDTCKISNFSLYFTVDCGKLNQYMSLVGSNLIWPLFSFGWFLFLLLMMLLDSFIFCYLSSLRFGCKCNCLWQLYCLWEGKWTVASYNLILALFEKLCRFSPFNLIIWN